MRSASDPNVIAGVRQAWRSAGSTFRSGSGARAVRAKQARSLSATAWVKNATAIERQLAQKALFMGGYTSREAIQLVDRALGEVPHASDTVMSALNAIRRLVEHPAELPAGSGLGEILALRMQRVLQNLGH